MLTIRYTRWDGSQSVRLDADQVFEKLSEYLSYTDDVDQALDWLMRHGAELEGMRVVGLDELLEQLRQQLEEKYQQFNLDHALDQMRRKLDELVDLEREALDSCRDGARAASKKRFLDNLSRKLSEAMEQLRHYSFEDADAARELEHLLEELENIQALERFLKQYRDLFEGQQSLGYEEALELMRQIEQLKNLEQQLVSGELGGVDLEALAAMLGEQAANDLRELQQMMAVVQQSGYLMPRQGRTALSPKGIRKIGKLALREIYQGLLRDKPGGH
ncbi:MAG TPA: hypothetical protein VEB21_15415, partial [Terriglobales bacterium]|nr:hypothetical protein [Terriglobales bacterium]